MSIKHPTIKKPENALTKFVDTNKLAQPLDIEEIEKNLGTGIYIHAPVLFCKDVFGAILDNNRTGYHEEPSQKKLVANYLMNGYTAVKSGKGIGKTAAMALIAMHFMVTKPLSIVFMMSRSRGHVQRVLFRETSIWFNKSPFMRKYWELQVASIRVRDKKYQNIWGLHILASSKSDKEGAAEHIQGLHPGVDTGGILVLIDEGSSFQQIAYEALTGLQTEPNTWAVLAGNPVRFHGPMYDIHKGKDPAWTCITINAEHSNNVSKKSTRRALLIGGGSRDSDWYRIQVKGIYPSGSEEGLVSVQDIEKVFERTEADADVDKLHDPIIASIDVSSKGKNKCIYMVRRGSWVYKKITVRQSIRDRDLAYWLLGRFFVDNIDYLVVDGIGPGDVVLSHMKHILDKEGNPEGSLGIDEDTYIIDATFGPTVVSSIHDKVDEDVLGTPIAITTLQKNSGNVDLCQLFKHATIVPFFGSGAPTVEPKPNKMNFVNIRAQACWYLKLLFSKGPLVISYPQLPENMDIYATGYDEALREQLINIQRKDREIGGLFKLGIESKVEMRKRGMKSPDDFDSLMMLFAINLMSIIDDGEYLGTFESLMGDITASKWKDIGGLPGVIDDFPDGEGNTSQGEDIPADMRETINNLLVSKDLSFSDDLGGMRTNIGSINSIFSNR